MRGQQVAVAGRQTKEARVWRKSKGDKFHLSCDGISLARQVASCKIADKIWHDIQMACRRRRRRELWQASGRALGD